MTKQGARFFGVPLDPPNSPERLNLKLAYVLQHLDREDCKDELQDSYDAVAKHIQQQNNVVKGEWLGKIPVESWLVPRPCLQDLPKLNLDRCYAFLERNGCWFYALQVAHFIEKHVLPHRPVMIGVDHSLTGGALVSLIQHYDGLNVVILDAHLDVLSLDPLLAQGTTAGSELIIQPEPEISCYHCGNFLGHLLAKNLIRPENLWLLGVQETALKQAGMQNYVKKLVDIGVHILSEDQVFSGKKLDVSGPTYVSVDMDVGSLVSVFSARYMNCYGWSKDQFIYALSLATDSIEKAQVPLVGLDIMEVDVHFLNNVALNLESEFHSQDYTLSIVSELFNNLSKKGFLG
jgi:arginase family enzyme